MIKFYVLTIFPELFDSFLNTSIFKRALESGLIEVVLVNIRDFAENKHRMTDDCPYGGGSGMIMKVEPIIGAIDYVKAQSPKTRVIVLSPQGSRLNQKKVELLHEFETLTLICGRYEGIDERVRITGVDEEISIGDYVLAGGELPAMVLMEAISRLVPGVLGDEHSLVDESFSNNLLEYPHFTRPREYRGMKVPDVLLSGNHKEIEKWRRKESLKRTKKRRPDLLEQTGHLSLEPEN